ncbi:prepilin-type N-terminal cleavage/methylation domain-containing protein [Xylophilus rhododendri]|uniref:Prepilin-type N-terminal cleavage/methylation domain-containing protein n=1 Tax=Xylophilus rhododendri TaxID=2697032 RepID=A0A857JAP4_9BURK|nr:PilW family protein [Xylophilus rhododendri]QHJ00788.1 prepilin-type N-terminal cleavage/methylation domain-containing protein [Xylophilus rhododendri]
MSARRQAGFSLIELLVGMALMLLIVTAASVIYLNTREADSAQARVSESVETGTFALQLLERDLTQAWTYPVVMPPATTIALNPPAGWAGALLLQTYPPVGWAPTIAAYQFGVYGCDGGQYNSITGNCDANPLTGVNRSPSDSLVINYFSSEAKKTPIGNRKDCTGIDVAGEDADSPKGDTINAIRRLNVPAAPPATTGTMDPWLPPGFPVFVSNRYGLLASTVQVDRQTLTTYSLACNGNGSNGGATPTNVYQPLLQGVDDLQITYGAFDIDASSSSGAVQPAPTRFYKASDVNNTTLQAITIDGVQYAGWNRIVAVRVCVMTSSMGTAARQFDKSGAPRTYLDCTDDTPQNYLPGDRSIRTRTVQVLAVRNRMNQIY